MLGAAMLLPLPLALSSPHPSLSSGAAGSRWSQQANIGFGIVSLGYGPAQAVATELAPETLSVQADSVRASRSLFA